MSVQGGFTSTWWVGFTDSQLDDFLDAIQKSSLLYSMLTTFEAGGGTITVGKPGGGTSYAGKTEVGPPYGTIIVDPTWLPNSTSGLAVLPSVLADILSHELGHAVLPNGNLNLLLASNPDAAVQISFATRHGLGCEEQATPGPRLRCHFQNDMHEAILAYDEDNTGLRVEVYFLDSAFVKFDAARKKTIDVIVHQFANNVKRSGNVRSLDWCDFPRLNCQSLWNLSSEER